MNRDICILLLRVCSKFSNLQSGMFLLSTVKQLKLKLQVYFKETVIPTLWMILVSIPVAESGPTVIADTPTYIGTVVSHKIRGFREHNPKS